MWPRTTKNKSIASSVLDAIYDWRCAACDTSLASRELGLCHLCLHSCEAIAVACPTCALPMAGSTSIRCAWCIRRPPSVDGCIAAYEYGGQISVALKRLKYAGRADIARSLAANLVPSFTVAAEHCDVAVAVPLHRSRMATRGFNQAQRLLLPLAKQVGLPVLRTGLRRTRETAVQAGLSRTDRQANLQGAFTGARKLAGKRVLLFDDVRTTGSTLNATALALRAAGATSVFAFVVARAEWNQQ